MSVKQVFRYILGRMHGLVARAGLVPRAALLAVLAVTLAIPASAQFFPFGGPSFQRPAPQAPPGWPFDPFGRRRAPVQQERAVDFSKAPAPKKSDTQPERNVVVLGDSMADWLAYGLEDAFSETPEIGVTRRSKTISGLIQYERKGKPADWVEAAKELLAKERADAVVIMLGLHDRRAIEEAVPEKKDAADQKGKPGAKTETKPDIKTDASKPNETKPGETKPSAPAAPEKQEASKPDDEEDDAPDAIVAPEPGQRSGKGGVHEFRSEKWVELYRKKIADLIAVARSRNAPVIWVGLPSVRGQRSTSDASFLSALFREEAGKANITYVDVWDGFVDEAGRFALFGPDFEGQRRRLRSNDGVYFTKAGARKLAHYAEREIRRVFASRTSPVALPSEPAIPDIRIDRPGGPAPRPLAGPIVPLVASSVGIEQLLGGAGTVPAPIDSLAARTLVKGEALIPPAGRADDFVWPRRDFGSVAAGGEAPVAATATEDPKPALATVSPSSQNLTRRNSAASDGSAPAQHNRGRANTPHNAGAAPPGQVAGGLRPPGAIGQPAFAQRGAVPQQQQRPLPPPPGAVNLLERLFGR